MWVELAGGALIMHMLDSDNDNDSDNDATDIDIDIHGFPLSVAMPIPIPIEIGIGPANRTRTPAGRANVTKRYTVHAYPTCNDSLFVHPAYPNHDVEPDVIDAGRVIDWTITHAPTSAMVMTGIPDMRTAMYLAGAVSKLWGWVHPKGSLSSVGNVTDFERQFRTLPDAVRKWILSWGYKDKGRSAGSAGSAGSTGNIGTETKRPTV